MTTVAPVLVGVLDRSGLARRCGPWAWRRAVRRMSVRPPDPASAVPYGSGTVLVGALVQWLAHPAVAAELVALRAVTPAPTLVRVLTVLGDVPTAAGRAAWRVGHARLAASFPPGGRRCSGTPGTCCTSTGRRWWPTPSRRSDVTAGPRLTRMSGLRLVTGLWAYALIGLTLLADRPVTCWPVRRWRRCCSSSRWRPGPDRGPARDAGGGGRSG